MYLIPLLKNKSEQTLDKWPGASRHQYSQSEEWNDTWLSKASDVLHKYFRVRQMPVLKVVFQSQITPDVD